MVLLSVPRGTICVSVVLKLLFLLLGLVVASPVQDAVAQDFPKLEENWRAQFLHHNKKRSARAKQKGPPSAAGERIPIIVTNRCESTLWPGIVTQAGTGPGIGGFELAQGQSRQLWVSPDWQGRVWGRTNCTLSGSDGCVCKTGDCAGKLDCEFSGAVPATLAEFNLAGGVNGQQTFYDISLVDGYNIPMGLRYISGGNTTFVPPNLTNCACIATPGWIHSSDNTGTFYSNSTFPVPFETSQTNKGVRRWCPWTLLALPPTKPGDGVYPYPDDKIFRPDFSPCMSACAATGSDKECCIGEYHDPNICQPSQYSKSAKAMCPDAYSYAFDDQRSTFIIPSGGGWEVIMCPKGRSTNILEQLGDELFELASVGSLSNVALKRLENVTYVASVRNKRSIDGSTNNPTRRGSAVSLGPTVSLMGSMVLAVWAWLLV